MIFDIVNHDHTGFISCHNLEQLPSAGTYNFIPNDQESEFLRALDEKPKDWYYRTNEVKYTVNSKKFRTKEFKNIDWKNSIVLLGCSSTFGVGVTDDDTIAAYLQKITGKYVVNLGSPQLSNGAIAYNTYYLKQNYPEPLAVVNLWSNMVRWFHITSEDRRIESFTYGHMIPSDVERINTIVTNNIMWMKMSNALWEHHPNHIQTCVPEYSIDLKTKLISITQKVFPEAIEIKDSWEADMSARDGGHWGREINEKIAKLIASNLKL